MATSAKNDVPLTLSVETVGLENIKQLKSEVSTLAKQGADAVPEFAKLGAEIDKLSNQSELVSAFGRLSDEVDQLAAAQALASDKSKELASSFNIQSAATDQLRVTEATLKAELIAAQRALFDKRQEMAALKNSTTDYADEARKLNAEIIQEKTNVRNLADAHRDAKVETSQAAVEETKLAAQLKASAAATTAASTKLSERNAALNATKSALDAAGVSTSDFAAAEADLVAAHSKLTAEVADTAKALAALKAKNDEMAESDRLLAIEQRGLAELFEKGRVALIAEETAFREATRASAAYTAAREAEKAASAAAQDKWQKEAFAIVEATEAKQRDTIATRNLIEAQNFLIAQDAEDKWQREAFAIVEATEAKQRLKRQTDLLAEAEESLANDAALAAAALRKTEDAAKEAGDGIANALGTVGVRSAAEIKDEIEKVKAALNLLKTSGALVGNELDAAFAKGASRIKGLERDLREANGQMTLADKAARAFSGAMGQFTVANLASEAVMSLVNRVQELGRAFIDAVVQGDQLRRGLNAVYKDATTAAQQIDFLRKTSNESGVAVGQLAGDFVRFSASMKSANIPIEKSNALFRSLTAASASLGIGTEATAGALNALSQMASKGVVSMEELRQQLGDRLPGALGLAAKAMGISEAQLIKLVESGTLATRDFIGPMTKGLETMRGEVDGLVPAWDRFKNVMTQTAQGVGDAGFVVLLTGALKVLGGTVGALVLGLSSLVEGLLLVGSGVTALAARLTGDTKAWGFFSDQVEKARVRLTGQADAFNNFLEPAAAATTATSNLGTVTAATAEQLKIATEAQQALGKSGELSAAAAEIQANATLNLAENIVKYNVVVSEKLAKQALETEGAQKLAKGIKDQGDQMIALAKLTGDSTQLKQAEAVASKMQADALDAVVKSQKVEVDLLLTQRQHLIDVATANKDSAESIKNLTAELDKKIAKAAPELQQMIDAAGAARSEATARDLVSQALLDNSAKMDVYKAAMVASQIEVDRLREAERAGFDVKVQLKDALDQLGKNTYLYNDAVKDSIANTELDTRVKSANLQLSIAQATASQNHYSALANEARASGDVTMAVYYEIQAKQESVRILRLKLELDKLQQEADLLIIETKKKLIDSSTEEGKVKLKVLEIETQMVKIRQAGNQAALDQISAIESETQRLRENTGARDASGRSLDNDTARRGVNVKAIDQTTEALKREQQARLDALGAAATAEYNSLPEQLKRKNESGKLSATDLADAQNNFDAAKNNLTQIQNAPGGTFGLDAIQDAMRRYNEARTVLDAASAGGSTPKPKPKPNPTAPTTTSTATKSEQDIIRDYVQAAGATYTPGMTKAQADQAVAKANQASAAAKAGTSGSGSTNTVNITIGGVLTPVNVASQTDARNLQSVLTQLANAQGRSI